MEFGLFYEIPVPLPWHDRAERDALHAVVAQAVRGEQVGFTHFWTVEHHFLDEFSHCSAPEVLYGAVAAKTSRIKIGHGVRLLPVPYNHPLRVGRDGGHARLPVGRTSRVRDRTVGDARRAGGVRHRPSGHARHVGGGARRRRRRVDRATSSSGQGRYFRVPPRRVHPKPLQRPHPPLWVASTSPDSHALAGRKGLGLLSFTIGVPPEELAGRIQLYRDGLKEAKPAGKFVNSRAATFTMVHCAETNEEARRNAAESILWYLRKSTELIGSLATWQAERERELGTYAYAQSLRDLDMSYLTFELLDDMGAVIVGDPERCVERVRLYRDAGCDQLLCLMNPYKIPPDKVMRSIELFGQHVIPAFREAGA